MAIKSFHTLVCNDCGAEVKVRSPEERPFGWGGSPRHMRGSQGEDFCPTCTETRLEADLPEGVSLPKIGQEIYINTSWYIDHGEDDVQGGRATINKISLNPSCPNPVNRIFVGVAELPGRSYNYVLAMREYDERAAEYGNRRAYPDPDV